MSTSSWPKGLTWADMAQPCEASSNFRFNGRVLGPRSTQEDVFAEALAALAFPKEMASLGWESYGCLGGPFSGPNPFSINKRVVCS